MWIRELDWLYYRLLYNNYSMSPSWIWSDKITNERVARVGYNHFISNKGKWNNCFGKFSNRVLPPIFISTILQSVRKENLAHYFPYDVKLGLLAHRRSFLANQKARNAIVGVENLLMVNNSSSVRVTQNLRVMSPRAWVTKNNFLNSFFTENKNQVITRHENNPVRPSFYVSSQRFALKLSERLQFPPELTY